VHPLVDRVALGGGSGDRVGRGTHSGSHCCEERREVTTPAVLIKEAPQSPGAIGNGGIALCADHMSSMEWYPSEGRERKIPLGFNRRGKVLVEEAVLAPSSLQTAL
jgi:hypothetical protein